jgi:hypothetical protein
LERNLLYSLASGLREQSPTPAMPDVTAGGAEMKCTLNIPNKTSFLPLRDAVLCRDCEFISADSGEVCSVCGSRSLFHLAELVRSSAESASVSARDLFQFFRLRLGQGIS